MIFTVAFAFLCLHGIVEGTYGPYSGFYGSQYGSSNNGWSKLGSYGSIYSGLSSYDTLNSPYSHALYPIGHHQYLRIPVKGGLTVVPAPKNLGYQKGYSSYGTPFLQSHIPQLKTPPLSYLSSLYNTDSKYFKEGPLIQLPRSLSSYSLSDAVVLKDSPLSSYSSADLSDISPLRVLNYKPLKSIKSVKVIEDHGVSDPSPIVKVHKKVVTPVLSTHESPKIHQVVSSHHDSAEVHHVSSHHDRPEVHHVSSHHDHPEVHHVSSHHDRPEVHHVSSHHDRPEVHHVSSHHDRPEVHHVSSHNDRPKVHLVKHTKLAQVVHEDDDDKHVLPISHHSIDIGHGLPIHHHSGIGHGLVHIHDSDIDHDYRPVALAHSGFGIHGSSHTLLHHPHDSHDVYENYDGHHISSLHGSHIDDDDDEEDEIINAGKDYEANNKHVEDCDEEKEPGNDYPNQEHVDDEEKVGKDDKTSYEHKEVKKSPEPTYIQQKKTEVPVIQHVDKDEYRSIQSDEYENKGYGKSSIPSRHPAYDNENYPQFPQVHKNEESYGKVKYSGGRYPVRPLKQSFYEVEQKSEEHVPERHPSYEQPKVEQQAHEEYKTAPEVDHRYEQRQTYVQPPKRPHYQSGSSHPRGRSKIYRNYESPRTSSYEIEILHSESSDTAKDSPDGQYSQDNYQQDSYEKEGHQSFTQEVSNDEQDSFDYQESQNSPVEASVPEQKDQE